ncbi:hypothetical protein LguiB_009597 [Lonicera macranthoides]
MDKIRDNPLLQPKDIVFYFKGSYSLDISYWNAWFGREFARTEVHGSDEGSYTILTRYVETINETNPSSRCVLEFDNETRTFQRLFVAFVACIEGFGKLHPPIVVVLIIICIRDLALVHWFVEENNRGVQIHRYCHHRTIP